MTKTHRFLALGALALLYSLFFVWFGGNGRPVTAAEGAHYLAAIRTSPSAPLHPEIATNLAKIIATDDGKAFIMVNMETHIPGPEARAETLAYAKMVLPALIRHASFPVYLGPVRGTVIGTRTEGATSVALVRYRSLRDFLEIFTDPAMNRGVGHKFAALKGAESISSTPILLAAPIRPLVGLIFLLTGLLIWRKNP
jgi:hypothetical protein